MTPPRNPDPTDLDRWLDEILKLAADAPFHVNFVYRYQRDVPLLARMVCEALKQLRRFREVGYEVSVLDRIAAMVAEARKEQGK